jgi:hypothetical protein
MFIALTPTVPFLEKNVNSCSTLKNSFLWQILLETEKLTNEANYICKTMNDKSVKLTANNFTNNI